MDIDVDEFMLKSTAGYNFQYIDVNDLDRIIRNVQRNSNFRNYTPPRESSPDVRTTNVRVLSDGEIDEILRITESDLKEQPHSTVECNQTVVEPQATELPDEFSDEASTVCSSSTSSIIYSSSRDFGNSLSDEIADVEDNLVFDDYCTLDDFKSTGNNSDPVDEKCAAEPFTSIETCFEFLDSETIVEEVVLSAGSNEGDSEGSGREAPIIKVISPTPAIIKSYENQCEEPVKTIQPVFDFEAIEQSSKYSKALAVSSVRNVKSEGRIRPPSRKSLLESFDTFIKITELQKKVCMLIDDIGYCLGKATEPEDDLERKKLEKRTSEFQIRFQRNYLYQINRLEEDIYLIPKESAELPQKIYQLYRCIYQGLKLYLKNMKYFVIDVSPDKLWALVKQIFKSTKVCVQKKVFDDDDLIVEELYEKCHVLKTRLKEEAHKQKMKSKKVKQMKTSGSIASSSHTQNTKLSMYGAITPVQKRRSQIHKNVNVSNKKPLITKPNLTKQQKTENVKKPQRGKITAVPMLQSSSSSLNCNKSSMRIRSARTPAKPIDDVVTLIQQQSDPLANSRLLKEVSTALTKMSTNRDAAISPEVNQQLHQLIMETIQNITRQQLKQLIPSLEHTTAKSTDKTDPSGTTEQKPSEATDVTSATDQIQSVGKHFSTKSLHSQVAHHHQQQQQEIEENPHDQRKTQNAENHDGSARAAERMRGRERVGDSHGSDCGKVAASGGRKGVDLEISGKISSHESNSPEFLMFSIGMDGAVRTSESVAGAAGVTETRRNLLDGRKRGTSDAPRLQKVNYSHNLQYLEIVSPPDEVLQSRSIPEVQSHINLAEEVANKQRKQQRLQLYAQLKKQICRDRLQTVRKMAANPIYVNANFERPWQTVSTVSDQLVDELMMEVAEQGLDFGEKSFVEEFLRLQLTG